MGLDKAYARIDIGRQVTNETGTFVYPKEDTLGIGILIEPPTTTIENNESDVDQWITITYDHITLGRRYSNQIEYLLCERTLSTEEIARQTLQSPLGNVAAAVTECQDLVKQLKEDADQLLRQVKATLSQPKAPEPGHASLTEQRPRRGVGALGAALARLVPVITRSGSAAITATSAARSSTTLARTASHGARAVAHTSTRNLGAIPKTGTRSLSLSPKATGAQAAGNLPRTASVGRLTASRALPSQTAAAGRQTAARALPPVGPDTPGMLGS